MKQTCNTRPDQRGQHNTAYSPHQRRSREVKKKDKLRPESVDLRGKMVEWLIVQPSTVRKGVLMAAGPVSSDIY